MNTARIWLGVASLAALGGSALGIARASDARRAEQARVKLAPALQNFAATAGTREYVVQFSDRKAGLAAVRQSGARVSREYATLPMAAVTANARSLARLATSTAVTRVSPDLGVRRSSEFAIPAINANWAQGSGATGGGVGIAVLDSGIGSHADLGESYQRPGRSRIVGGYDFIADKAKLENNDDCGHGTLVAGIAAGNGFWSTRQKGNRFTTRRFLGVAPKASLLNLRVLDADGQGSVSDVIAALDWCLANKQRYNLRVVNLSMGHAPDESYRTDPLCQAVERVWKAGIVVVCAAGNRGRVQADDQNSGASYGTIDSPANDPYVITVGTTNDGGTATRADDTLASYSSRGPSRGDHVVKPDVVAPGNFIVNLRDTGGTLEDAAGQTNLVPLDYYWNRAPDSKMSKQYFALSGTSMSAAFVSGAVALMLQRSPGLSPDTVKARLMLTARKLWRRDGQSPDAFSRGAGLLDVYGALRSTFVAQYPALSPWAESTSGGILLHLARSREGVATLWGNQALWGDEGISPPPGDDTNSEGAPAPDPAPDYPAPDDNSNAAWGDSSFSGITMVGSSQALWGDEGFQDPPPADDAPAGSPPGPFLRADQALWGDEAFVPPVPGATTPQPPVGADVSRRAILGDR